MAAKAKAKRPKSPKSPSAVRAVAMLCECGAKADGAMGRCKRDSLAVAGWSHGVNPDGVQYFWRWPDNKPMLVEEAFALGFPT